MKYAVHGLIFLLCCGCHSDERLPDDSTADERLAPEVSTPAAPAPAAAVRHEALPRAVVGVTLGMRRAEAEEKVGQLACHENKAGFQVCTGAKPPSQDVSDLELYVVDDRVISVTYEEPAPANMGDALSQLIDRYGRPALSGVRERDTTGRLHEIYGWKDEQSLYSVRFVWRDTESGTPELVRTVTALWDRLGYQQWEAETRRRGTPPDAEQPREAT